MGIKMKNYLLTTALLFWCLSGHADIPNQVQIHYQGTIVAQPCDVSVSNISLDFGDIDVASLAEVGAASSWINNSLRLNNCELNTTIEITTQAARGSPGMYADAGSSCGYYVTNSMINNYVIAGQMVQPIYGIQAQSGDVNLACYYNKKFIITPAQRMKDQTTSVDFPMKFRIVHRIGDAVPLKVTNEALMILVITYS